MVARTSWMLSNVLGFVSMSTGVALSVGETKVFSYLMDSVHTAPALLPNGNQDCHCDKPPGTPSLVTADTLSRGCGGVKVAIGRALCLSIALLVYCCSTYCGSQRYSAREWVGTFIAAAARRQQSEGV